MICRVGIDGQLNEWSQLLDQIGISNGVVNLDEIIDVEDYPVLIMTNPLPGKKERDVIRKFMQDGGSLMTEASSAQRLFDSGAVRRRIRYLLPDCPWTGFDPVDVGKRTVVAKEAEHAADQSGRPCVQVMNYLNGLVVILPDGLAGQRKKQNHFHRYFCGSGGLYHPMENISAVGKGGIRRLIQNGLMILFHAKGLPFVRKSYMPYGYPSLLIFRMDTDYSSEEQILRFYEIMQNSGIKASWFIDVSSQLNHIAAYKRFQDHEIAYHCFRHRTFSDEKINNADFEKGLNALRNNDIHPKGYAAPQGLWFPSLARSIEEFGFEYSSEFSYSYDDVPLYPHTSKMVFPVLQIPVHPISTGRLRQARFTADAMAEYLKRRMDYQIFLNEPAVLYDHPAHGQHDVFEKVFDCAQSRSFRNMTMLEYARWWKKRNAAHYDVRFDGSQLNVLTDNADDTLSLHAVFPDQTQYELPFKTILFDGESLKLYRKIIAACPPKPRPEKIIQTRKTDLRLIYNQYLFHYRRMKQ